MKLNDKIGLIESAVLCSSAVLYWLYEDFIIGTILFFIIAIGSGYITSKFQKINDAYEKEGEQ